MELKAHIGKWFNSINQALVKIFVKRIRLTEMVVKIVGKNEIVF